VEIKLEWKLINRKATDVLQSCEEEILLHLYALRVLLERGFFTRAQLKVASRSKPSVAVLDRYFFGSSSSKST
jgi:hypothetical protein